jgi:hypothetical protein
MAATSDRGPARFGAREATGMVPAERSSGFQEVVDCARALRNSVASTWLDCHAG